MSLAGNRQSITNKKENIVANITFDTSNLSALDYQILALLGEVATAPAAEAEKATAPAKAAPAKKAAAAKPAKVEEPEPEEEAVEEPEAEDDDLLGGEEEPTVKQALDVASKKVQDGKAADVKKILVNLGVKKVSELDGNVEGLKEFIAEASKIK